MSDSSAPGFGYVSCTLADGSASQGLFYGGALGENQSGHYYASGDIPLTIAVSSSSASTATLACQSLGAPESTSGVTFDAWDGAISAVQTSSNSA
jgi:hypothetical protein